MAAPSSLGQVYDPLGEHLQDPYPFYEQARREEPVFYSPIHDAWVVTRYADIREVLLRADLYSSRSVLPRVYTPVPAALAELAKGHPPTDTVISLDGDAHRRVRSALLPAFSAERVRALEPFIREQAGALLDAFAAGGRVELMKQYAELLPVIVIGHICGIDDPEHHTVFRVGFSGIIELFTMPLDEAEQVDAARRIVAAQNLAVEYTRARRADPTGDLASRLATSLAPGDGPLTPEQELEVSENLFEILIAGQITTGPLIGNAVHRLLERPERWQQVSAQPELIPKALEESLRFESPSSGLYRETNQEVTLGGVELPKGARLTLRFNSANRDDPAVTDRSEQFDVTRTPTKHLSFGFGAHYCIGAPLARLEGAVSLELLTRRLPGLRLDTSRPVSIRAVHDLRGPDELHLTW